MEDDFSIFHTGNFLPFHTTNLPIHISFHTKIFFHIPFHAKVNLDRKESIICIVPLQVVAHKGKQFGMMHFIQYLKHYRNELP